MTFPHLAASLRDRYEAGRRLRKRLPRKQQARWTPAKDRPDPIETLASTNEGRVARLLPEKYRRMRASPFSFFRGAAVLMASDLSRLPRSGITVQRCGTSDGRKIRE